MNQKIIQFLLIILFTASYGCQESFLEKGLLGELQQENFMVSENDIRLATNATYNVIRQWRYSGGFPIADIMSDDATKGSNQADAIQILEFDNFTFDAASPSVSGWYTTLYEAIKTTNLVIEKGPAIEMDEALKNRFIGEAKFIRALTYFRLATIFGDAPLVTTINPDRIVTRSSVEEIYTLIESDLNDAITSLPEQSAYEAADVGRASRGAARALLAKVSLYQEKYDQALELAEDVINSGQYQLIDDFAMVHSKEGEFGSGSIFEIGARPEGFQLGGNQYGNTQGFRATPNRGWGFNRPTYNLITFFEENDDPRKDPTIIFLNEILDGVLYSGDPSTIDTIFENGQIKEIEAYNQKAWVPGTGPLESWDHNVRILRYADVILMAAEAAIKTNQVGKGINYINQIRERARGTNPNALPDVSATDTNIAFDLLVRERRAEMTLEQNRYFDLIRWGLAPQVLGPLGFQSNKNELFPIPQSEIDLSEGALTQNPGWN